MSYCFLIREPNDDYGEKKAMTDLGIPFVEHRTQELPVGEYGCRIVGRYSVQPFYQELEKDLKTLYPDFQVELINSYRQYRYCADLGNWYRDLFPLTPLTWDSLESYLRGPYEGPVVLKGETSSKRHLWSTHMFANDKNEARQVYCRLLDDGLIGTGKIYIRKFEKFKTFIEKSVAGHPIINEWRVFVFEDNIVSSDFYWANYRDEIKEKPEEPPIDFIREIINKVGSNSYFYSIDVAQKEDGSWMVVELNEGQQSGLNGLDPKIFYSKMKKILDRIY